LKVESKFNCWRSEDRRYNNNGNAPAGQGDAKKERV